MARAPRAIQEAMVPMVDGVVGAVFSGIVGDVNHSYGYHLARNQLPGNDYSVQYGLDREGPDDAASALDISLPAASMTLVVNRLMDASLAGDPRLFALREWFGARSGEAVTGWDFRDPATHTDDRVTTADDSHKWHIHLSGYRRYADDLAAWAAIADVFTDAAPIGGALSEEDTFMPKLTDDQQVELYDRTTKVWQMIAGGLVNNDPQFRQMYDRVNYNFENATPAVLGALQTITQLVGSLDTAGGATAEDIVKQLGEAITKGTAA